MSLDIIGLGTKSDQCPVVRGDKHVYVRYCKMELTNEATIITGQVNYFPNEWFRVVGRTVLRGESGKEYKLLKAEGITLNEQIFLPESGRMTFQLYFEPVDAGEKKVDYVEGNHETDWRNHIG